jgi:rubrerythrin
MKYLRKILTVITFFSLSVAFRVYAEEAKTPESVPSEAVTAVQVAPSQKTTLNNLQAAFNGESNARVRYLAFAQKADAEGYGKVASLFRATARAEQAHLEQHARAIKKLGGIPVAQIDPVVAKSTAENLEAAMKGEIYESAVMYPEFLAEAEKSDIEAAINAFEDASAAEAVHAGLYKEALENLKVWKVGRVDFYVCPLCGNVVENIDFTNCPICGTAKEKFLKVS